MKKKQRAGMILLSACLIAVALIYVIPFLMMLLGSFKVQAEAAMFDLVGVFQLCACDGIR